MKETTHETARDAARVAERYFTALKQRNGWQELVTDDVTFRGTGLESIRGKPAFVELTTGFLQMVRSARVKRMIADGDTACSLMNYELTGPNGTLMNLDVVDVVTVRDGKIAAFDIYFDSAAFQKFVSGAAA